MALTWMLSWTPLLTSKPMVWIKGEKTASEHETDTQYNHKARNQSGPDSYCELQGSEVETEARPIRRISTILYCTSGSHDFT